MKDYKQNIEQVNTIGQQTKNQTEAKTHGNVQGAAVSAESKTP